MPIQRDAIRKQAGIDEVRCLRVGNRLVAAGDGNGRADEPASGLIRMCGVYAFGLPDCDTHSVSSMTCWIALAPGTMSTSRGRLRSGMFSVKPNEPPLRSEGVRAPSESATRPRNDGDRRAISMMGPPGTFRTPARMSGSTPSRMPP